MSQSKTLSMLEAMLNVVVGFGINFIANLLVLPLFGYVVSVGSALQIGLIFTAISIARGYAIRRWFNKGIKWPTRKS